jgi:hypothetical protein
MSPSLVGRSNRGEYQQAKKPLTMHGELTDRIKPTGLSV